ncbi:unnamed protein product [Sphacelaria rigidula]
MSTISALHHILRRGCYIVVPSVPIPTDCTVLTLVASASSHAQHQGAMSSSGRHRLAANTHGKSQMHFGHELLQFGDMCRCMVQRAAPQRARCNLPVYVYSSPHSWSTWYSTERHPARVRGP